MRMTTRPSRSNISMIRPVVAALVLALPTLTFAQSPTLRAEVEKRIPTVLPKVVAWRRDIHEHPELSGEEKRTSALVAAHLKSLGLEVRENIGGFGVVGVLRGAKPGPVVALRADMDGLPVTEQVDLPFRSHVTATYNGQTVGVMHACGHDNHVAVLMGTAELLTSMKSQLPGTVVFLFQPAEETKPDGEGGAEPMIKAGALTNPKVDAVFALHVTTGTSGQILYRSGPTLASDNSYRLVVRGKQTHGAQPWAGVDPIVISSQIVGGFQTIISRQANITASPAIVTVGVINGGIRDNIIPDSVVMRGIIRTFSDVQRDDIVARMRRTADLIAQSGGATAELVIDRGYPVTVNDADLTERMLPTLRWAAGGAGVAVHALKTNAEDFSFYTQQVPGVFVFLGVTPKGQDPTTAAPNHSPSFFADEAALPTGIRLMSGFAVDYLSGAKR